MFILVAHAANELNVFAKLFHFSSNESADIPIMAQVANAQALALGRVLAGKIYECWKLLQNAYFGTSLSKDYFKKFDVETADALKEIQKYFGQKNPISEVRNTHAFHYAVDQIDGGYNTLFEGDPLDIYLSKATTNTFYAFGDTIAGRAMLETIKPGDAEGAFDLFIEDTLRMVDRINTVIGKLMEICIRKNISENVYALGIKEIQITGAPNSQEVFIPFFVDMEDGENTEIN